MDKLKKLIRAIPDYPHPGVVFRDITTLLSSGPDLQTAISKMLEPFGEQSIDAVAGIEARGFILGGAIADRLECGFIPVRKKGKLPWKTTEQKYTLEYGVDSIEIHQDALTLGEKILIVDDLIATGGTAQASVELIKRSGGEVVGTTFIISLPKLGGVKLLKDMDVNVHVLVAFDDLSPTVEKGS